jgi:hypothetical protein
VFDSLYEVYRNVPGLGQKRNAGLTYSILAAISFKIVSLGTCTVIPSFFSTLQKHWKSFYAVKYCLQFPLDVRHCFKTLSLHFNFNLGNKPKSRGKARRVGRMGNDNHIVVSHKVCGFQGRMGGRIVMMEPVVFAPKFGCFHHTFSLRCLKTS